VSEGRFFRSVTGAMYKVLGSRWMWENRFVVDSHVVRTTKVPPRFTPITGYSSTFPDGNVSIALPCWSGRHKQRI
jgi:hypothetical protein